MPLLSSITVPATTANLGPGFDCIGVALSLYNQFDFIAHDDITEPLKITVEGPGASTVTTDKSNLVYQAFAKLYAYLQQDPPPIEINIKMSLPLARGLGSSATAIIGGLSGANELAGVPLNNMEIIKLAIEMEKHPDNVVPALMGGCRLAVEEDTETGKKWHISEVTWNQTIVPVIAVPSFTLATSESRSVLPLEVSRKDAIFNLSRLGLLIKGLEKGEGEFLRVALQDKIHQPYRQMLIPGYPEVRDAAVEAGAYGVVISGSGPSLLALTHFSEAKTVAAAMLESWTGAGISAQVRIVHLERQGIRKRRDMMTRRSKS